MADPRDGVRFEGIGRKAQTFNTDGSITYAAAEVGGSAQVGGPVKIVSNSTVAVCADGDEIDGLLESVEPDGKAVVQTEGYAVFAAAGALAAGSKVSGAGSGLIKVDGTNGSHEVVNGAVAAAIVVKLDKR